MTEAKISERIEQLRVKSKLSVRKFADQIGIPFGTLNSILNGATPRADKLAQISQALEVSLDWLVYGKEATRIIGDKNSDVIMLPKLTVNLSAGGGLVALEEDLEGEFAVTRQQLGRRDANGLMVARVEGDSMETEMFDGDYVVVDTNDKGRRDGIFAIWQRETGAKVKRIHWLANGIKLVSNNPNYSDEFVNYTTLESGDAGIAGRVILVSKRYD